jgi:superfamily II helicase
MYDYPNLGWFQCDKCHDPLWQDDPFIRYNGKRICLKCVQDYINNHTEYASYQDSSYQDNINRLIHERIEEDGRQKF